MIDSQDVPKGESSSARGADVAAELSADLAARPTAGDEAPTEPPADQSKVMEPSQDVTGYQPARGEFPAGRSTPVGGAAPLARENAWRAKNGLPDRVTEFKSPSISLADRIKSIFGRSK